MSWLTPDREQQVVDEIQAGQTIVQICKRLRVHVRTVHRVAQNRGLTIHDGRRKPDLERLRAIYQADQLRGRQAAANEFGISVSAVSKATRNYLRHAK